MTETKLTTTHRILHQQAEAMDGIADKSVDLVITSPPYPMIAMWDEMLGRQNRTVARALKANDGMAAFEAMHTILDPVWTQLGRVLKAGGFACINIGDATRTIDGHFALYPNHARIVASFIRNGFTPLPEILWRKQTNAPNKFMGSGMLPAGAYVTLEHEHILVLRKGAKRRFDRAADKALRRQSAYFWEERNQWFSDVWFDIKGRGQNLGDRQMRRRSAAFPLEIPYRLINMYSVQGDCVLDPFLGTGTTTWAAIAAGRNSIGIEPDRALTKDVFSRLDTALALANDRISRRLDQHVEFITRRLDQDLAVKHFNQRYGFPVVTAQERELLLHRPRTWRRIAADAIEVRYRTDPRPRWPAKSIRALKGRQDRLFD